MFKVEINSYKIQKPWTLSVSKKSHNHKVKNQFLKILMINSQRLCIPQMILIPLIRLKTDCNNKTVASIMEVKEKEDS